ncbi:hypothetical protein BH24GEM2_BH24GEM2_08630 [soil metagenome]
MSVAYKYFRFCQLFLALSVLSRPALAQQADTLPQREAAFQSDTLPYAPGRARALVTVGSTADDRVRLGQLLDSVPTGGYLIRSPSSLAAALRKDGDAGQWSVVAPEVRLAWTSSIPFSLNNGAMWQGRGASAQFMTGLRAEYGPVSLILAPQLVFAQNRRFATLAPALREPLNGRSAFSSPWVTDTALIDLPIRFGDEALVRLDPGQSSLTVTLPVIATGVATENQWWGPGIRNAIVMSNNAPGIPHFFVRTASPLRTPIGAIEAKWMVGALEESLFFDTIATNDLRSLSGAVVTLQPRWERDLTLGLARVVYAPANGLGDVLGASGNVFGRWERRAAVNDTVWTPRTEQILSLFGRWIFPADGFEAYAEWARHELPVSFADLLRAPNHTQGYTVGLQWARPLPAGAFRLQAELTKLEQSATFKQRAVDPYYTSRVIPQGYTHQGQVIGAAIGPGSSSQWLAGDYLGRGWDAGLFLGRIRWETDALYPSRSPAEFRDFRSFHAHDVSMLAGVRGGYNLGVFRADAEFVLEKRYDYLFQHPDRGFGATGAVDIINPSLRFMLSPVVPRAFRGHRSEGGRQGALEQIHDKLRFTGKHDILVALASLPARPPSVVNRIEDC